MVMSINKKIGSINLIAHKGPRRYRGKRFSPVSTGGNILFLCGKSRQPESQNTPLHSRN